MSEISVNIARQLIEGPQGTAFLDIPGGSVLMGSTVRADERPVHEAGAGCTLSPPAK